MNVTTITGEIIDKKLTRKIKNLNDVFAYYKIGNINQKNSGDCYQINNIFYTIEKGRIVWDEYLNQYVLKTSTYEGIVDNTFRIGFFSRLNPQIALVYLNKEPISQMCISTSLAEELGLIQGEYNLFYNPTYYTYDQILPRQIIDRNYKNSLPYNFKDNIQECSRNFENFKIITNEDTEYRYSQIKTLLSKYTFGVELETTQGMIPLKVYESLGVRPVRDGSISGLEYVTIPLTGRKGLYAFVEIIKMINKYTSSDYTCSMHIHVGNIPRTMEFIVAAFKTIYFLQNEIYRLFPLYKQYNTGIKRQCYTAPLCSYVMNSLSCNKVTENDLKEDYRKIIYELSGKHEQYEKFISLENIKNHPYDPSESSKWNMKSRYKIVNLIPLVFTNKQTIEYRIFTVPDTIEKAMNFLTLALSITDFITRYETTILNNIDHIKPINLQKIFQYTLNDRYEQSRLLSRRETTVSSHINQKGAFFEEKEIKLNNNGGYIKNLDETIISMENFERRLERAMQSQSQNEDTFRESSTNELSL